MNPQKVLFFLDTDKDDLYSLCLICAQHYYGIIEVIGIVIDAGFIYNIQDGLLIVQQWLNKINVGTNIDHQSDSCFPFKLNLYAGLPRPDFLALRLFPDSWITTYISDLKTNYNITIPNFDYANNMFTDQVVETTSPSVNILFNHLYQYCDKSILCLTTSPSTSLGIGLDKFPFLSSKIESIYSMASNYLVPGNVPLINNDIANITLPNPYLDYSGEYNSFMNPYSLQRICLSINSDINVNIIALDCTNYAELMNITVAEFEAFAKPFLDIVTDQWTINLYNYFISLVSTTLITETDKIYLWDLCATNIALGSNIKQYFISGMPKISVTGKSELYYYSNDNINKVKIYTFLSYQKLLLNTIRIIFNDPQYKS